MAVEEVTAVCQVVVLIWQPTKPEESVNILSSSDFPTKAWEAMEEVGLTQSSILKIPEFVARAGEGVNKFQITNPKTQRKPNVKIFKLNIDIFRIIPVPFPH